MEQWGQVGHGLELGKATLRIDSFLVASHWDQEIIRGLTSPRVLQEMGEPFGIVSLKVMSSR